MTRSILDPQFHETRMGIIQMGTLVETALAHALQALQSGDQALCSQVIEADHAIDDLRFGVEQSAFQLLTHQQPPLGEQDLRFLSSVSLIAGDLERIGDNAAGIAKLLLRMTLYWATGVKRVQVDPLVGAHGDQKRFVDQTTTEDSIVHQLFDLGQEACRMLRETMRAFEQNDAQAARKIWQEDDVVDVRYHLARHDLMTVLSGTHAITVLQQDALILQRMTYWFWIAHNLERVGDHCTNICERIVYVLEGDTTIKPLEAE